MSVSSAAWRGLTAGLVAGLTAVAVMEVAAAVTGVPALPQALQQPILAVLPGPLFGFLIDTLQHWGKVVEEAGLLLAMVLGLGALGAASGVVAARRPGFRGGLTAAAAGWLVIVAAVLPLGGYGLLGLSSGLATPIVWALVLAAYAFVWEALFVRSPVSAGIDPGRRRLLRLLPLGIGLGSLAVISGFRLPEWTGSALAAPEAQSAGPVAALTPAGQFYVVSKNFQDPDVRASSWTLRVTGMVGRPLRLSLDDLARLPQATRTVTLECISNDVGGRLMSTGLFTGVPLRELLAAAMPEAGAAAVNFTARDGFTEGLPLALVMDSPDILVAHQLDGAALPVSHGFPARVVIPGRYGMKGPKWLDRIDLAAHESGGYWEGQGWDRQAVVKTTSRFDAPRDGEILRRGPVVLAGVAFAGTRGVQAVEWSADGGSTWSPAALEAPLSPLTWALWRATWTPPRQGSYRLVVRAVDGAGAVQEAASSPSFPAGATGYHTIRVAIGG